MTRTLVHVAIASALAGVIPTAANASDIAPYFEFEVLRKNGPSTYSTDVNQAATELVAVDCEKHEFVYCEMTGISYFNSLYTVAYNYEDKSGAHYRTTVWGYRYYTCDVSPSLYLVNGNRESGPYANRTRTPPPPGGHYICRTTTVPGDGAHSAAELGDGDCMTRPAVGNPINAGTGNKFQVVNDIVASAASPLEWSRYYNSGVIVDAEDDEHPTDIALPAPGRLGGRWRGTYERSIEATSDSDRVRLHRHTGEDIDFVKTDGRYRSATDPRGRLVADANGWLYDTDKGTIERYDTEGRLTDMDPGTSRHVHLRHSDVLLEAIDAQGRMLVFSHDTAGRIDVVRDDSGVAVTYNYANASARDADLVQATYADGSSQRYTYNEKSFVGADLPHALTGIFDESGLRFATFRYDATGRAISSEHQNAIDRVSLAREADGSVSVTGPTNAVHRYRYTEVRGVRRLAGVDQPGGAGCGAAFSKLEYDDRGSLVRRTQFDGRSTDFTYDADGRETSRTEAAGTPLARITRTEWHPTLMLPTRVTLPGREERLTYDNAGNVTRRELWAALDPTAKDAPLTLSRVWTFAYDADGRLTQEYGPRSDSPGLALLRRYTYRAAAAPNCASGGACDYRKGDLATIENALGHKEEILRLDPVGRVLAKRLPNGALIEYSYTPRGWLSAMKETRSDGITATSTLTYNERGNITSVTDADGVTLRFEYDMAGRMVKMSNPSNHRVILDLDKAGHPVTETTYDTLFEKTQIKRTFDALGRVATEQGKDAGLVSFTYDEVGRPTGITDGDGHRSSSLYDALGRLRESIDDLEGRRATVATTYDPLDQPLALKDPDGVTTGYLSTGMGDLAHVDSPDAGETYDEHDATGLVTQHEGAGGVGSFNVTRDALGRPLQITYADPGVSTNFTYDVPDAPCPGDKRNGLGQVSSITTRRASIVFCYDAAGNVTRKAQRWDSHREAVTYTYTMAGRLASMGVDGGAITVYRYDIDGKINGVSVEQGGTSEPLITKVAYRPFDSIESWTYANNLTHSNSRDKAGRVTAWGGIDPKGSVYWLDPSPGGKIRADVTRPYAYTFGYDGLDYLNAVRDYNSGKQLLAFDYNASGDRLSVHREGLVDNYSYQPGTHRLAHADGKARRYDDAGNLIAIGDAILSYDAAGRLASTSEQGKLLVSYGYDGEGNRVARTVATGVKTTLTLFDEAGRWVADYDDAGQVTQQAIWMGDLLVGLVTDGKLYYVSPDHLGSPREILDPQRNVIVWHWRHNADPFGSTPPDEDPDGDGKAFVFDLRFPGQRYDSLTGLHANGARDYDPTTGRYIQSDPLGLADGPNLYAYAHASPLSYADPSGEIAIVGMVIGAALEIGSQALSNYRNGCDPLAFASYNWRQVGLSAIVGAIAPGVGKVGAQVLRSRSAIKSLSTQLSSAQTPNRIAKLQSRITRNSDLMSHLINRQAGLTVTGWAGKKILEGNNECACGN